MWPASPAAGPSNVDSPKRWWIAGKEATQAQTDDPTKATHALRVSARALRLVLIERWGERLGSMGREWTRFERMADRRGQRSLAAQIAALAAADTATAEPRADLAPPWLQERIDLSYAA